jgi:ABC-type lipoprotein export system ATPase subunit/N-acetylglutamate synthase-like GNAT family acetyltransferase
MLLYINLSFKEEYACTRRISEVAEAFGIGLDRRRFTLFNHTEMDVKPRDIIYITGDSGGGKSVLLHELLRRLTEYQSLFGKVCTENDIQISPEEILVESIGNSTNEAISYLSYAGLNDAYLFLRKYKELSDGQKYRYKLAKMLSLDKDVLIFDEFCSMLDRETAKAVAFCVQKIARRTNKTLIVATAHGDLIQDLSPSVLIRKNYGYETDVSYHKIIMDRCSLMDGISIEQGTVNDWHSLEYFHYRSGIPYGPQKIFVAKIKDRIIAAIIYSNSPLSCKPRNRYLGYVPTADEINQDFLIISRVVVLPKFRGIGLAVKLIKETLSLVNKKYVETIAVMAKYNPFFVKAGMTQVKYEHGKYEQNTLEKLNHYGFKRELCADVQHNLKVINNLKHEELSNVLEIVASSRHAFGNLTKHVSLNREDALTLLQDKTTLAEAIAWTAKIAQEKCYYIWQNREEGQK